MKLNFWAPSFEGMIREKGFFLAEILLSLALFSLILTVFFPTLVQLNINISHHAQQQNDLWEAHNCLETLLAGQPVQNPKLTRTPINPTLKRFEYTLAPNKTLVLYKETQ